MSELSKFGWYKCLNDQHNFHPYEFNVMKIIWNLIDCSGMLKINVVI